MSHIEKNFPGGVHVDAWETSYPNSGYGCSVHFEQSPLRGITADEKEVWLTPEQALWLIGWQALNMTLGEQTEKPQEAVVQLEAQHLLFGKITMIVGLAHFNDAIGNPRYKCGIGNTISFSTDQSRKTPEPMRYEILLGNRGIDVYWRHPLSSPRIDIVGATETARIVNLGFLACLKAKNVAIHLRDKDGNKITTDPVNTRDESPLELAFASTLKNALFPIPVSHF